MEIPGPIKVGESPPSPATYWVRELKLSNEDKMQLMDGEPLSDKHNIMDGSALVLAKQFPDMLSPQTALRAQGLDKLQPAKENSIFFHNYSSHWALSHPREGVILSSSMNLSS